ncbi:uncharacterized protein LOC119968898 [Scyliorhinus canicula]|uniref:uncharacterized protein LOC119968898 n=1 Tax=Scyliorhinus canicula TaxID=7830 RepID=UPI0018F4C9FC|nr:uncharacterized protein LOC119968898 [Scyliorhinus canicula]
MTVDTPSGPTAWRPIETPSCHLRKQIRNKPKEKYEKQHESDESQENLMSTKLSSRTDPMSDIEILKDGNCIQSTSKLQTRNSLGNMNVGDKFKIDVDILTTSDGNLEKQVLVECVGRTKDKPLIMFTPMSKAKVGLSRVYPDCSDDFQTTLSEELNHLSTSERDVKDDSNLISSMSSDLLLVNPLCELGSKELSYPVRFEKSRSNVLDLGETISTCINDGSVESHDDKSSGLSDTILIDFYPSMLASMSNLLDRGYRTQVASRLIKHYRHLQLNSCKSKLNTTLDRIRMNAQTLKEMKGHPVVELKAWAGTKHMNRKLSSLKRCNITECNPDTNLSTIAAEDFMAAQTNSKSSEIETFELRNSYSDANYSQPLLLSPCKPRRPVPVTSCCDMKKTLGCVLSSLNGQSLPQLDTVTDSSFKCFSTKPNMAKEQSPCSRIILHHAANAKQSPLNNSTMTKEDSAVASFSRSPFRMHLCPGNISYTGQRSKWRHSFPSESSIPTVFHSIKSPFNTQEKEMDTFESMYHNLVRTSFSLSTTVKLPNILNVCSVPGKTITSMISVTNSPTQLSRKRAACIDQLMETSQLPLKRFRFFSESSSSRQSSQKMLLLNTVQEQNYDSRQMSDFHSPRRQQPREAYLGYNTQSFKQRFGCNMGITLGPYIKWEDNARLYSSCGTALPVINRSGNTVSLCLSPRLRNRVSRKLDYSELNTPSLNYPDFIKQL